MNKLFFGLNITWPRLIISAVGIAAVVALLNCVPALENTSLTAPAVNFELWLMLGLVLSCNAQSAKDAMLKVFVFFLVSQPLIYLLEVPFKAAGWGLFAYYPYWAAATVLTIPLAWVAYQIKLKNIIGALAACLAVVVLAYMGAYYVPMIMHDFPHWILAAAFCFACAVLVAVVLVPKNAFRLIALAAAAVVVAALLLSRSAAPDLLFTLGEDHTWQVRNVDSLLDKAEIRDGNILVVSGGETGTFLVTVENEQGETLQLLVTRGGASDESVDGIQLLE